MKILFVQTQCKQIIGLKIKKYFILFKSAYISLIKKMYDQVDF